MCAKLVEDAGHRERYLASDCLEFRTIASANDSKSQRGKSAHMMRYYEAISAGLLSFRPTFPTVSGAILYEVKGVVNCFERR